MSSTSPSSARIDEVRQELCRQLAGLLSRGATHVRVRVAKPHGNPAEVWFYSRNENHWQKQQAGLTDPAVAELIEVELADIAAGGSSETCSIRTHSAADWCETDFQFPKTWLEGHSEGMYLESSLMGVLFRDRHASGQDSRRRTHPHRTEVNRP
jgi:hypothetical protein